MENFPNLQNANIKHLMHCNVGNENEISLNSEDFISHFV